MGSRALGSALKIQNKANGPSTLLRVNPSISPLGAGRRRTPFDRFGPSTGSGTASSSRQESSRSATGQAALRRSSFRPFRQAQGRQAQGLRQDRPFGEAPFDRFGRLKAGKLKVYDRTGGRGLAPGAGWKLSSWPACRASICWRTARSFDASCGEALGLAAMSFLPFGPLR